MGDSRTSWRSVIKFQDLFECKNFKIAECYIQEDFSCKSLIKLIANYQFLVGSKNLS